MNVISLARMIEHCQRQKARDIAFWDELIFYYQTQSPDASPPPPPREWPMREH